MCEMHLQCQEHVCRHLASATSFQLADRLSGRTQHMGKALWPATSIHAHEQMLKSSTTFTIAWQCEVGDAHAH